jgi:hypothetical protein
LHTHSLALEPARRRKHKSCSPGAQPGCWTMAANTPIDTICYRNSRSVGRKQAKHASKEEEDLQSSFTRTSACQQLGGRGTHIYWRHQPAGQPELKSYTARVRFPLLAKTQAQDRGPFSVRGLPRDHCCRIRTTKQGLYL